METESGPDIVIDVFVEGRMVNPNEIPTVVTNRIEASIAISESGTLMHAGVVYEWSTRPCVYP